MIFEFQPGDFIQAVGAAAKVSPSKGDASGILLDWSAKDDRLVIAATDLASTYRQSIPVQDGRGDPEACGVRCLLPARQFAAYVGRLPSAETTVTVEITEAMSRQVIVQQGRSKATFNTIETPSYPEIPYYPEIEFQNVESLGSMLKSVVFACGRKDGPPLDGVHIDGETISATDKKGGAMVKCDVPVENPITVPLRVLSGLFVREQTIGLASKDDRLILSLDVDTQLTSQIYVAPFPALDKALRRAQENVVGTSDIDKQEMLECLQRINGLMGGTEGPRVELTVKSTEIELRAEVPDLGTVQEFCSHETVVSLPQPLAITFNPKSLMELLNAVPSASVVFGWPETPVGFLWAETQDESWQAALASIRT